MLDGFVKSLKSPLSVIPAQVPLLAGYFQVVKIIWIPVFTGMTTSYDSIILDLAPKTSSGSTFSASC